MNAQVLPALRFEAMHCPCEIMVDTSDNNLAAEQLASAVAEAERIEAKFSRYRRGNIVDQIHQTTGKQIEVDDETAALLDFAATCYDLSGGLFDITTGILRKVWRFEQGVSVAPAADEIERVRNHIGWDKVSWRRPYLTLPVGFELDFGGICKEYAADRILELLVQRHPAATLVNLGGDIAAAGERLWSVGIEDIAHPGRFIHTVHLRQGAVATSGTTRRFTTVQGEVLGHILNPKTGWPVRNAPQSVTVAAPTCTEAGLWSTLGMLQGLHAEHFLEDQGLEFWCYRPH